jgi:hypothetical protein
MHMKSRCFLPVVRVYVQNYRPAEAHTPKTTSGQYEISWCSIANNLEFSGVLRYKYFGYDTDHERTVKNNINSFKILIDKLCMCFFYVTICNGNYLTAALFNVISAGFSFAGFFSQGKVCKFMHKKNLMNAWHCIHLRHDLQKDCLKGNLGVKHLGNWATGLCNFCEFFKIFPAHTRYFSL